MDDFWLPDTPAKKHRGPKYKVGCKCGHEMRVKPRHLGRMCRCTKCNFPIYVTYENVSPRIKPNAEGFPRYFSEDRVPVHWKEGDLFMETYEVRDLLGKGGMGVVYKVRHRGWDEDLAVKSPKAALISDEAWIDLFEHECETWINLPPHPNTVQCYYVRRLGGVPRVFVEFVEGRNLGVFVADKSLYEGGHRAALRRILDIAIQFARGLHHAHVHNVIHQDVKPSNVIIGPGDIAKVTDFGLARAFGGDARETPGSTPSSPQGGTPVYRSPDHALPEDLTPKTDIWSWGVSIIELFAGEVFWRSGETASDVLANLLKHGARYEEVPPMPDAVADLLRWCFEPVPEHRPADMTAVAEVLENQYFEVSGSPYGRSETGNVGDSADSLNNRAVSFLDLEKSDESEALWRRALEADPDHIEALYNYNLHLWRTGRVTDTEFLVKIYDVCEERPDAWLPQYLLARVLMERGEAKAAIQVLESLSDPDEYRRDVAFALAMAQNIVEDDRRLVWECREIGTVTTAAITFDAWRAVTGELRGDIRIWETSSGKCEKVLRGHTDRVNAVVFSDKETVLLSASSDQTLKVWDPATGKCLKTLTGHERPVVCAALSPDAKKAVSGATDGTMKLWSLDSGKCLKSFTAHEGKVDAVVFSREGGLVLSGGSDRAVRLWNPIEGDCLVSGNGSVSEVRAVSLRGDASVAISASGRKIKIWDLNSGKVIRSIRGHRSDIESLWINADGKRAFSATREGTIKIWNIETGQCVRSLKGHAPAAVGRDGRYAISTGAQGQFKVWAVNLDTDPFQAPFIICRSGAGAAKSEV